MNEALKHIAAIVVLIGFAAFQYGFMYLFLKFRTWVGLPNYGLDKFLFRKKFKR